MNTIDPEKLENDLPKYKAGTSKLNNLCYACCNSTANSEVVELNSIKNAPKNLHFEQNMSENSEELDTKESSVTTSRTSAGEISEDFHHFQNNQTSKYESNILDAPVLHDLNNSFGCHKEINNSSEKINEVVVKVLKPLCADYKSDSESESVDSESDSSTVSVNSTTDTTSEEECTSDDSCDNNERGKKLEVKELKKDLYFFDLPPIEDLKISVPEDACVEIGTITSIVETLVVVESYKGTAALDLDTVLFLDSGKRTLGKVFDILGPVTEPVYAVRFNSHEQIKRLNIEKNLKVYYAPKTQHTAFVFMSEVLKNKGSDASWKDNSEAPLEFQDFSDDEQERLHKNKQVLESVREQSKSKKRPYNKVMKPSSGVFQTSGFRNPNFCPERGSHFQRNFSGLLPFSRFPSGPPRIFDTTQTQPSSYNFPPYPTTRPVSIPPSVCFSSRFSGPPFPEFSGLPLFNQNQNFQYPFYQERTHGYLQNLGPWGRPMRPTIRYQLPPPPPPPSSPSIDRVV